MAFLVSEQSYDDWNLHGVFSTREKAQVYIDMVANAEKTAGILVRERTGLTIDEVEIDEFDDVFPVFAANSTVGNDVVSVRIQYLKAVPESRFFLAKDETKPFGAEAFGLTPAEAKAKLKIEMGKI